MTEPRSQASKWDQILLAWLHDPPDKALSIGGHVSRARDNAKVALGDDSVSKKRIEECVTDADPMAAVIERLPMPTAGGGIRAVDPQDNRLYVIHPLSAARVVVRVPDLTAQFIETQREQLRSIVGSPCSGAHEYERNRFLSAWRLWPELLAVNCDRCCSLLPADTRVPDHTIWNHLDVTAAFKAAEAEGGGAALLAFALGPVQRFIEAARSVRDLWSGSMILSWLAFRAMLPIIERLGPTALVYPALRGNPLLDLWLRGDQGLDDKVTLPETARRLTPSLPHRFLALVPCGDHESVARAIADECKRAVTQAWMELADATKSKLRGHLNHFCGSWDKRWDTQIANYFSTATTVVPLGSSGDDIDRQLSDLLTGKLSFAEAFPDAAAVREMARVIPESNKPAYPQNHAGRWQYQVDLVNRSLAAARSIRHVPTTPSCADSGERVPEKCTLLGSFEQMGPDDLAASKRFWDDAANSQNGLKIDGVRIRKREALCAVAMVKRFAGPIFLREQLHLSIDDLRFPDTWTVAAAEWLAQCGIDWKADWREGSRSVPWNGQWLHWLTRNENLDEAEACPRELWERIKVADAQCRKSPVYYAILKLDGDDLGGWLRGERSPRIRDVMHTKLVEYYEGLGDAARAGLDAKRPVSPGLHAAISTALANFALHAVPDIVPRHHGTTIYSGGDDTLVLLPVGTALACALELRRAYMSDGWRSDGQQYPSQTRREHMMMGSQATLSGGLVIVHAKDDLRLALQDARRAERQAKEVCKDALVVVLRRRSGEHTSALCPWDFVETVENWRQQFRKGASDRWAYHLKSEQQTLAGLESSAIKAEIRRQVNRAETPTRRLLGEPAHPNNGDTAGDILASSFERYRGDVMENRGFILPRAFSEWLALCHTASFMARGRD